MRDSKDKPIDDDLQADVYNPFDDVPDDDIYRDTEDGRCERARAKFTARKLTWMTAFMFDRQPLSTDFKIGFVS
jgi:hypothetical protein